MQTDFRRNIEIAKSNFLWNIYNYRSRHIETQIGFNPLKVVWILVEGYILI